MILNLNKFGKFRNKSFEISDNLTLFYGENESGKTTIFDSLMLLFSENKKTSSFAKQIKLRYGDDIDINTEPEIDESIKLHPQSYNNLYSIRQSEIIFEMSDSKKDSKDWESEIKKKLFASDIDVGKIISEVKAEYAGKSQSAIPAQLKNTKYRNEEIEEELNDLYSKANTEVNKKDKLKELDELLKESNNILKEKIDEYNKLIALREEKNKAKEKNHLLNINTMIHEFNKKDQFIKDNINLRDDHSKTINTLSTKIDESENRISFLKGKIESLQKSSEERNKTDYQSMMLRIDKAIKKIDELKEKNNKIPKIVFLAGVILVSALLSLYFKNPYWFLIILPSIPFLLIKEGKNDKFINDILDSLPEIDINSDNLELSTLKDILLRELAKIELILEKNNDEELENYKKELEEAANNLENHHKELNNFFNKLNVKNKENYYEIKSNFDNVYKSTEELFKKLMIEAKKFGLKDIDTLNANCNRILKELDEKGINPDDYNEMEMKALENKLRELEREINSIKENMNKVISNASYIQGELNSGDDVHKKIVNLESEFAENNEEIKNLNKRKKALELLENMLSKINKKNDDIFNSLSNEAELLYNHITGKNLSDDVISMSGFDKNKIMVKDKQNEMRNVELLSSATKDAVYIAMRLSILSKIHETGRLILLDDPFITFDNKRTKEALSFIREYSKKYNIPIAIFTKDVFIRDIMKNYQEAIIHELS
ncbi:AAA family ATPase [Brachyspira hyodysenteriae]|uniref:ATP-binding protein n=1 Tax=Brachyspira hyodysenteriae TaxID=159 RepID=UPI0022CD7A3B|nr:AAA family ATPase [Brachyspira hyodysenteriae]MCZ9838576.1 AAA family ATPase [Brachyspira hyodysenteriae]MCZ9847877.1 AAA family ATPase [Brachyspira hyodysenteriae]MCZ9891207.1 AAA family ATPase [Brachyspira hyodysenteriae]MCZ9930877.1 AAA family ATPase [Brachyspira hyodysenteriae]MCZ9988265.1 AAA family ATPase [Brachyspira hyodysenteriae]